MSNSSVEHLCNGQIHKSLCKNLFHRSVDIGFTERLQELAAIIQSDKRPSKGVVHVTTRWYRSSALINVFSQRLPGRRRTR